MKAIQSSLAVLFTALLATHLMGKDVTLFDSEEPVGLSIVAPLKTLKKQRGDDPEWLEAKVILTDSVGVETVLNVQIKARGNFRRLKKTCPFPSYWLNFKKKQVTGTVFDGQDRIKVVAHCRETRTPFDPYIYKEYLAYKTYNLITDQSFQVRLASIDYVDTESKYREQGQVAFFIEHTDTFEDRHGVKLIKDRYVVPSLYDLKELCRAEIFQYLVSNTDFTFFASQDECCHNGKAFLYEDGSRGHFPVPYDFDLSGLVDAPYAKPNPALKIRSVTTRMYRGVGVPDEIFFETLELYKSHKSDIYTLWENFEPLLDGHRLRALDFIDKFYETIEDPKRLEKNIEQKMRSLPGLDKYILKKIEESDSSGI